MNIGETVKGIFAFLFEDVLNTIIKPILDFFSLVTLSPTIINSMPFFTPLCGVAQSIAWALLLLLVLWQGLKSMGIWAGMEAEEPVKIAVKTLLAGLMVAYISDLLMYFVGEGGKVIDFIIQQNNAIGDVELFELILTVVFSGGLFLILGVVLIYQSVSLLFRMFKRLALCAFLIICAPFAAAAMVSKTTEGFWQGFVKVFVGNIVIQWLQSLCFVAMFSCMGEIAGGGVIDINQNFNLLLTIAIIMIAKELEDVVKEISLSVGMGRDMQRAIGKVGAAAYAVSSVQNAARFVKY